MKLIHACIAALTAAAVAHPAWAQGKLLPISAPEPIRGMTFPSLSPDGKTLCFTYLGDLWTVATAGGTATRLTVNEAQSAYSRWSPDGRWIAFASNRYNSSTPSGGYALNYDIFVIPATGGEPRRITYYTDNDFPSDWSPDGSRILFQSRRNAVSWQAYTIDVSTGVVHTLTADPQEVRFAVFSPNGKTIAYDRSGDTAMWWRPRYHGSANMDIYTKDLDTGRISRITDYDGMDLWPMYSPDGRFLYYVTDRLTPGTPNLVMTPASGGRLALVTHFTEGEVRFPNIARTTGEIVFEHDGDLYLVKPAVGAPRKIAIYAFSDEKRNNLVPVEITGGATEVEIAPDGKTLALVARGEIWTIPAAEGGEAKRLTDNPAKDYDIVWSPDSTRIAFASDRRGNFNIYVLDVATGQVHPLSTDPNDENAPRWSPDGRWVSFLRSGPQGGLYIAPADGSAPPRRLAPSYGNNLNLDGISSYSWSPDSHWLAFSRRDVLQTVDLWLVSLDGGDPVNITLYPGTNIEPEWASNGRFIVFLSDRDRPRAGMDLYTLSLQASPSDPPNTERNTIRIDLAGISERVRRITTQGAGPFAISPDSLAVLFASSSAGQTDYYATGLLGGPVQRLTTSGDVSDQPKIARDGTRFYYLTTAGTVKMVPRSGGSPTAVAFSAHMTVDHQAEIHEAFNEFWRRIKVGFYDPTMHGVDWEAVRRRYEPLLQAVGTKEDFWYLLSEMVGELNASHTEVNPAPGAPGPAVAELGMTFDENYPGPGLRLMASIPKGPNDDPRVAIKPGEYILKIDGHDVHWTEAYYNLLLGKAGKPVELVVNSKPSLEGARTVTVKPITRSQWFDLEYERQVHEAEASVQKLSGGKLAYIRIKAMDVPSLRRFERDLWGAAFTREGLVLDIRGNGGGNTHDTILSELARPIYGYTQARDGLRATQPFRRWSKPIVLLINQDSASDAEIFTSGFRALKLGKIVGTPTPGYVIGTYDSTLQDGTAYRIPTQGFFDGEGRDMENRGVRPDVLVEITPQDSADHRDPQLEEAVRILLEEVRHRHADQVPSKDARAVLGGPVPAGALLRN
ncbi:MAG: S41 family peptidase [Chthonomonadales bacterium]